MPVTNYDTLHGEIIAEYTDGVQLDYLKDALGSVTAWVDQNCNIVATARYKPFGDILVSTGTLGRFTWVGTRGYRSSGLTWADIYVRARHYGSKQGQWTTVDPLWPEERAYGYARQIPTVRTDYFGLRSCRRNCKEYSDPCKWAEENILDGRLGGVVCCGGVATPCSFYTGGHPAIEECILLHEQVHANDFKCTSEDGFLKATDGYLGNGTLLTYQSECYAYRATIICLLGAFNSQEDMLDQDFRDAFCTACTRMNINCTNGKVIVPEGFKTLCDDFCGDCWRTGKLC